MCSFFFLYFFLFHSVCRNFSNDLSKTSSVAYNIAHCCCLCDLKSSFMAINRFCSPQQQTIPLQISLLVSSYRTMPWTEMFLWRITSTYWHESLLFPATMKSAHKYIRFLGVFLWTTHLLKLFVGSVLVRVEEYRYISNVEILPRIVQNMPFQLE